MLQDLQRYFSAEKSESLLFVAVGILAIGLAVWLWQDGYRLRSAAFPLIAIALIQLVVGGTVFLRTDGQVAAATTVLETAPAQLKHDELARMDTVMRNFNTYKIIEITLLGIGCGLILVMRSSDVAVGIGQGLVIQSAFMLFLDLYAESRGEDYLRALHNLTG
ncbi:MAG: hypothetical protein ACKO2S_02095 [Burkholderiaceae bacterium]